MASWIQKASNLIDTIDQVANDKKEETQTQTQTQTATDKEEIGQLSLKKQYDGMVQLWNEERINLKKAQQLLREQKNIFSEERELLENEHIKKISDLSEQYQKQIQAQNEMITKLHSGILSIENEKSNDNKLNSDLGQIIEALKQEKEEILRGEKLKMIEKQKEMELIKNEFELEKQNFQRETRFLENENLYIENTNALAKTQSLLQQKELEQNETKNQLKWIRQEQSRLSAINDELKNENISVKNNITHLKQIISDKDKERMQLKNELQISESQYMKPNSTDQSTQISIALENSHKKKQISELEKRLKNFTNVLLQKQAEIDHQISKKNEYKIKLEKTLLSNSEVEITTKATLLRKKTKPQKKNISNLTSYKSINYGINVFDRVGLEFAHVLRHKPFLRLLIIFYIIVLHLWCFIVLHFSINFGEDDQHH